MRQPDSNVNPASQPWTRWAEQNIAAGTVVDEELAQQIAALAHQSDQFLADIGRLRYELRELYDATSTTYPPTDAAPPPTVEEPPTYGVWETNADWSRTWGSSSYYTGTNEYTNGTYLYQGQSPENKIGMWHFNMGSAAGKQIVAAEMFLRNINIPWQSATTAGFGTHGNASPPVGKPSRQNFFDVGWSRGEAKWFVLPSWTYAGLSNGSIQGFTVGGNGASNALSAYWAGVGQAAPPRIKVTYVQ